MPRKYILPLVDRKTPVLDLIRENPDTSIQQLLKEYSWLASWLSLAIAGGAVLGLGLLRETK